LTRFFNAHEAAHKKFQTIHMDSRADRHAGARSYFATGSDAVLAMNMPGRTPPEA